MDYFALKKHAKEIIAQLLKKETRKYDRDVRKPMAITRPNVNTQVVTESSNLYTQNIIVSDVQFWLSYSQGGGELSS